MDAKIRVWTLFLFCVKIKASKKRSAADHKNPLYRKSKEGNMAEFIKKLYRNQGIRYIFFGGCTTFVNLGSRGRHHRHCVNRSPNTPAARPGGFFAPWGNCTGPGLVLYWSHKERTRRRESAAPEIVKNGGESYGSIDCILHRLPVSCGHQPDRKAAPPVHCGGHQEH